MTAMAFGDLFFHKTCAPDGSVEVEDVDEGSNCGACGMTLTDVVPEGQSG